MALTQEEINKIHEEEAERAKARQVYSNKHPQTVRTKPKTSAVTWGCLWLIIIGIVGLVISGIISAMNESNTTTDTNAVGKTVCNKENDLCLGVVTAIQSCTVKPDEQCYVVDRGSDYSRPAEVPTSGYYLK